MHMPKPPESRSANRNDEQADGAADIAADNAAAGPSAPAAESTVTHHTIDANSADDRIELDLIGGYAQRVNWGVPGAPSLIIDEPAPLGEGTGPSPGRVLAAALASCLGASLVFCLKRSRIDVLGLHTTASTELARNEQGRLRVRSITVQLDPVIALDQQPRMARCLEMFEDYCVVTASVRPSVTVNVSVNPVAPTAAAGDAAREGAAAG